MVVFKEQSIVGTVPSSESLVCTINLGTGAEEVSEVEASPLRHKGDFLDFFTPELIPTQYSHGITHGFSSQQYSQLSVPHIPLPRQGHQLPASPEPHRPKLAPSP